MDVSRDQLILSCEDAKVQWGAGHPLRPRTIELYPNQIIYCFEEACNSTQKMLREKIFLHDCRVVDVGVLGAMHILAIFLWDHTYLEEVDWVGNTIRRVYPSLHPPVDDPFSCIRWGSTENKATCTRIPFHDSLLSARECSPSFRSEGDSLVVHSSFGIQTSAETKCGKKRFVPELFSSCDIKIVGNAMYQRNNMELKPQIEKGATSSSFWKEFSRGEYLALLYVPKNEIKWIWLKEIRHASGFYDHHPHSTRPFSPKVQDVSHVEAPVDASLVKISSTVGTKGFSSSLVPGLSSHLGIANEQHSLLHNSACDLPPSLVACLLRKENQICADCRAPHPAWCVLSPFGVCICIDCIGVHRQLWANKCRAVELDFWDDKDVQFMCKRGNAVVNRELGCDFGERDDKSSYYVVEDNHNDENIGKERINGARRIVRESRDPKNEQANLFLPPPISSSSSIEDRKVFIYAKYVEKQFASFPRRADASSIPQDLDLFALYPSSSSTISLPSCFSSSCGSFRSDDETRSGGGEKTAQQVWEPAPMNAKSVSQKEKKGEEGQPGEGGRRGRVDDDDGSGAGSGPSNTCTKAPLLTDSPQSRQFRSGSLEKSARQHSTLFLSSQPRTRGQGKDEEGPFSSRLLPPSWCPSSGKYFMGGGPPRYRGVAVLVIKCLRVRRVTPSSSWASKLPSCVCVVVSNDYQEVRTRRGKGPYLIPNNATATNITRDVGHITTESITRPGSPISSPSRHPTGSEERHSFSSYEVEWNETVQLGMELPTNPISISLFSCSSSACCNFFRPRLRKTEECHKHHLLAATDIFLGEKAIHSGQQYSHPDSKISDVNRLSTEKNWKAKCPISIKETPDTMEEENSEEFSTSNRDHYSSKNRYHEEALHSFTVPLPWCHLHRLTRERPCEHWSLDVSAIYCSYT